MKALKQKHAYVLIVAIYAGTMIPAYFYLSTLMIVMIPLFTTAATLYLLRGEYMHLSLADVKRAGLGVWTQLAVVLPLLLQIGFAVFIGRPTAPVPSQLMTQYPIIPVYMLLNAPLVEEVVFRKLLFLEAGKKIGATAAALISSVLFGALHNDPRNFALYFCIGLAFCLTDKKSGSVLPSLIGHAVLNLLVLLNASLSGH